MLILPYQIFASGSTIGNGGNGIVCNIDSDNRTLELLDYFELRINGGTLALDASLGNYMDILSGLLNKWKNAAPRRMDLYQKWLNEFPQEAAFVPGITIPPIADTGIIAIPKGCEIRGFAFQRPDSEVYHGVKRYVISKDLWDLMPEIQKAGLILHELIYREGIQLGHTTSYPTRYFNGYLSSATPVMEEYASVASSVPLGWVEYGGFLLDPLNGARVSMDGQIKHIAPNSQYNLKGVINNTISLPRLNIDFTSKDYIYNSTVSLENNHFSIDNHGSGAYFSTKEIHTKFKYAELRIIEPFEQLEQIHISIVDGYQLIFLIGSRRLYPGPNVKTKIALDPVSSWYKQYDGSIIKSIESIERRPNSNNFGDIINTSTGEVWLINDARSGYARVK